MAPGTMKTKCQNFLSTLIRVAGDETAKTASNVKKLIQNLIDGVIVPEEFSTQLQKELQSNHQPHLSYFLKKSLPFVRQALISGEMTIECIRPPPVSASMQSLVPTTQMSESHQDTATSSEEESNGETSSSLPVESSSEDETANLEPPTKRRKRTEDENMLPAVTSTLEDLGTRQDQPSLNASIGQVVHATLENLNAEEQRQCISEIFNLLSKYITSSTSSA